MEIPLAATFLGLFGWNIYQLVKKYKARQRQSCLVKLIDDQSNSLIMTLQPYKKRKISDYKEVIIKNPQNVEYQENQEQHDTDSYKRIQTVLDQVEHERFQEQDYIDNAQTFDSIVSSQNKDDLNKNKQTKDFSFTSQNQNYNNNDLNHQNLDINNQVNQLICQDLVDQDISDFTFTNTKEQQYLKSIDDDCNFNNQILKQDFKAYEDQKQKEAQNSEFYCNGKNNSQSIQDQAYYPLTEFQERSQNLDVQTNAFLNYQERNQEESILPYFPQHNPVIAFEQQSNLIQNFSQSQYETPILLIDVHNQNQQQQFQQQYNQNYANFFNLTSQPIYSVNNNQQSNQLFNQQFQGNQSNSLHMDLFHHQNSNQYQPKYGEYNYDIKNQNTTFGFKEPNQMLRTQKEEEQFSFKKRNTKFDQFNIEQNYFKNEGQKANVIQIQEQKQYKGQSVFFANPTDNQSKQQKEFKSNHFNDFSFYLQLLGGGAGGLNTKVSVPSANLLQLLLKN